MRLISAGFFHNVVIDDEDNVYTWGCNPQVLRLEAQQKKRERLQTIRKEMERQHQQQEVGVYYYVLRLGAFCRSDIFSI